uniref:Uncharacterized protein n=1 Tax=Salix viminalis TaxID=40686 RepID=A0A6N2LDK2_SALVM
MHGVDLYIESKKERTNPGFIWQTRGVHVADFAGRGFLRLNLDACLSCFSVCPYMCEEELILSQKASVDLIDSGCCSVRVRSDPWRMGLGNYQLGAALIFILFLKKLAAIPHGVSSDLQLLENSSGELLGITFLVEEVASDLFFLVSFCSEFQYVF